MGVPVISIKKIIYEKPIIIPMDAGYGQVSPMACASGGGVSIHESCSSGDNPGSGAYCVSGNQPQPGVCVNGTGV